jgi:hypothetical protein
MTDQEETDAHILLADISGYTQFLRANTTVLRHANYVISELLAAVMHRAEERVRPEKLEGDAILFIAQAEPAGDIDDCVRRSIFGFFSAFYRRRAELIDHNTCPCEACSTVHRLDLKVIDHFGKVLRYKVQDFEELAGFDIIVAHRLLKNALDSSRYLMVSDAAWARLSLEGKGLPTENHVLKCEGVGEVSVVVIRGPVTFPDEQPYFPKSASIADRLGDFLIKHLILLPFGDKVMRRKSRLS